jgi:hypothetical protein
MSAEPPRWSEQELAAQCAVSAAKFRTERLAPTVAWTGHYTTARTKFDTLFKQLDDLNPTKITDAKLAKAYQGKLGEVIRYLAGPPISDDDLKVIADVNSLAPGVLGLNATQARKVFKVIERVIDPFRFPWIVQKRAPTAREKEAALLASSVLLAAQRIATERRSDGKNEQENRVKDYLKTLNFKEVPPQTIDTIVNGPQAGEFCSECKLRDRKADVVVRLHDTRLLAIECKVSNSSTNSVKRVNNDAAVKATYWIKQFGEGQVVPSAVLSGVFKTLNLVQAQKNGLVIFWAHDLDKLGAFIASTKATGRRKR